MIRQREGEAAHFVSLLFSKKLSLFPQRAALKIVLEKPIGEAFFFIVYIMRQPKCPPILIYGWIRVFKKKFINFSNMRVDP